MLVVSTWSLKTLTLLKQNIARIWGVDLVVIIIADTIGLVADMLHRLKLNDVTRELVQRLTSNACVLDLGQLCRVLCALVLVVKTANAVFTAMSVSLRCYVYWISILPSL